MAYWAVRIPLYLISLMPLTVLYGLSNALYVLLYHIIRYRKALVKSNLKAAFPNKSNQELLLIEQKFYRNLCDMAVETIKLFSADVKAIKARFEVNDELYHRWHASGRSILQASGHLFNWEWANWLLRKETPYATRVLYMFSGSKALDRAMTEMRERQGSKLIAANDLRAMMLPPEQPTVTVFLADQNPSDLRRAHWSMFMGRPAPFHRGLEIMARRTGQAVVFEDLVRIGQGRYRNVTHVAFENGMNTHEGEVTEAFVRWLETRINEHPENWLWTHNRWKHRPPAHFNPL